MASVACLSSAFALVVFIVSEFASCTRLDVIVSPSDNIGKVIFNASLGPGWKYKLSESVSPTVTLSIDGLLQLTRHPDCNSSVPQIISKSTSIVSTMQSNSRTNYTITPVCVHLSCVIPKSLNLHSHIDTVDCPGEGNSNYNLLVVQMDTITSGSCLRKHTSILSVKPFIPAEWMSCLFHSMKSLNHNFALDRDSGNIITSRTVCFTQKFVIIPIRSELVCKDRLNHQMPIKVVLHPNHHQRHRHPHILKGNFALSKKVRRRRAANNPPRFPETLYLVHVPEEEPAGYVLDTFTAIDTDSGSAGIITYTLFANRDSRSQSRFSINPSTGQVTTAQRLDRETMDTHYFQITATDGGTPPRAAYATLRIFVDDINDHSPQFERQLYSRSVSESSSVGSTIITVVARDDDSGDNGEIEYNILNPSGANEVFLIDPRSGTITTRSKLDRERDANYTLQIAACDRAQLTDRQTATTVVEVEILDENDNRPQFSQRTYSVDIPEDFNADNNPVILHVTATDDDAGDNGRVRYQITGGNDDETFAIDRITGEVSLRKSLDFELRRSFRLTIRAQDNGATHRSNTTTALVRVLDINDHTPRFHTRLYQESVREDIAASSNIIEVQAYDRDSGPNSELLYSITDANDDLPFSIDQKTGRITNTRTLDREVQEMYNFHVEARDQGEPSRSATVGVEITVRDINDNAPIFNPRVYHEIVSEEAPIGRAVLFVTAVDADDAENAKVTYTISSGDDRGAFNIINQMGQGLITVAKKLNYKQQNRYILTVTASDPKNLVDTATVSINISDANTHRPVFQNTPYATQIPENTDVGRTVLQVQATDQDTGENARISYSIDENDAFQMDDVTGEILVHKPLDRELVPSYTLSVTATDHGHPPQSETTDVEITLLDVNDNAPKFAEASYTGSIYEDAYVSFSVLTISATDDDINMNGMVRYTFEGGNSGGNDFSIDPTLGSIRVNRELDRERRAEYELQAFAVDRGDTPLSTSVTIHITVLDVNDNAPQFQTSEIDLYIRENSPIGSVVHTIQAHDPDTGPNAIVEYSIVGGLGADSFALTAERDKPAVITTLVELDYESGITSYNIIIKASSRHLFSEASVNIYVEDINDNEPQLSDFVLIFNNYPEHFLPGYVGQIPAHDPDVSDRLVYNFVAGNQARLLDLDRRTGRVQLDSRLNSDVPTNGSLTVSVSDGVNEVRAQFTFIVRLITQDMLYNSITVRLANLTQNTFLSPLYFHFLSAVANIMETTPANVFVFDVRDHETLPVLMVSFSVRLRISESRDIFYEPQMLRERVYLQRSLLTRLSTLEVLPFDDDICLAEPCLNLETCVSTLKFGDAKAIISSSYMLFRPIQPISTFKCQCPVGVTGSEHRYWCDVEVNLCYSSPCGEHGTCIQREGGYTCLCEADYTGDQCQFNSKAQKYESCPANVCKPPSRCTPLIRGGFRCELCSSDEEGDVSGRFCDACDDLENYTSSCELTTRSFGKGSFLVYASLKRSYRFHIKLTFATRERNALLFYNGRYNERHDFIALEIIDGQIQFSFSTGNETFHAVAGISGGVSDGQWHNVTVEYSHRTALVVLGDDCDIGVSLRYGTQLSDHCAAQVTHSLPSVCDDVTVSCHRVLDFTGPFQLGGLPSLPTDFQVQTSHFAGCIKKVFIDHELLDLNDYVWNNGTQVGCPQKRTFCADQPCANGGTCAEAWRTYQCECTDGWGGKDCTQRIDAVAHLNGDGFLLFETHRLNTVNVPWFNGLSFRTRTTNALLMSIAVGEGTSEDPEYLINMELVYGYVHISVRDDSVYLDNIKVNDGRWHYLETRWLPDRKFLISLDFGQIQKLTEMDDWIVGRHVGRILVGGRDQRINGELITLNGLKGCVKDIRVGNSGESVLSAPRGHHALPGCPGGAMCSEDIPCPENSQCVDEWQGQTCLCDKGYRGDGCDAVCRTYNPCQNGAQCREDITTKHGYICICPDGYTGEYCSESTVQECANSWWGSPVCGPCDCDLDAGYQEHCNQTTGQCYCKEFHYQPREGLCLPCGCYDVGSLSRTCNLHTGQCQCKPGVRGRRCDSCQDEFSEVMEKGCQYVQGSCPQSYAAGILWERTKLGQTAIQECPYGTIGVAQRVCNETSGWQEAKMYTCMSVVFSELASQLEMLERGMLRLNNFVANSLARKLSEASASMTTLSGQDVNITYQIVKRILSFENSQSGLNLTHTQQRNFIQNLVYAVGHSLDPVYNASWAAITESTGGGLPDLMHELEEYSVTLAKNIPVVFTQPFDTVHDNIVFGVDTIANHNMSSIPIPKYNNKVRSEVMFDETTRVNIPTSLLQQIPAQQRDNEVLSEVNAPQASVSYILYKNIGPLLPPNQQAVNSPVFTLTLVQGDKVISGDLEVPVEFDFKEIGGENKSSPLCAYWRHERSSSGLWSGMWTDEGCLTVSRRVYDDDVIVTCQCHHLSSFAVVMVMNSERTIYLVTYVALSMALVAMVIAMVMFICVKRFNSNINSIHLNSIFCLFVCVLTFLIGINRIESVMACKIISILLHFFYLAVFAWMFVEALHIYRMLSEIRNINLGTMKFYYIIGYVFPGIIVSLAVGLRTENYYNEEFCWISRHNHLLFWSLAGPICLCIVLTSLLFFLAVNTSCHIEEKARSGIGPIRYGLKVAILHVAIGSLAWVFGILSVNDYPVFAFHYLFAVMILLQGAFILAAYVFFSKEVRNQLKYQWYRWQGRKDLDDTLSPTQRSMLNRSALSYHNENSFDGQINRVAVGVSTTSTTSQSTSKSSGAIYPPDYFFPHSSSTSTSNNGPTSASGSNGQRNTGIPPYNYHTALYHQHKGSYDDLDATHKKRKKKETDSDSELSALEHPDLELASSHSSDDDDEDDCLGWGPKLKGKVAEKKRTPIVPPFPMHHTPSITPHLKMEMNTVGRVEGRRSQNWNPETKPLTADSKHQKIYDLGRQSPNSPLEGKLLSPSSPRDKSAGLSLNGSIAESELSVETTV